MQNGTKRMLEIRYCNSFKKDYKVIRKRGYDISLLTDVINTLRIPAKLPERNKDHALAGSQYRDYHVLPDWILLYRYVDGCLELYRTGTHSDLFR